MLQPLSDTSLQSAMHCVKEERSGLDRDDRTCGDYACDNYTGAKTQPARLIDKRGLESLFQTHTKKLHNFVRSRCCNLSDVDDLVQDTFLQATVSFDNFSGKSSFSTWLLGIALNLIRNYYNRSPEYKYAILDSDVLQRFESKELTPEMQIEQNDRLNELQIHLQNLPELSRDMITVLAVEGVCYEEISERFDVSVSSVKSRLFRTRERLRESILLKA